MSNVEFELAEQFALYTRKHCFVSGRAGTGKTTLLRELFAEVKLDYAFPSILSTTLKRALPPIILSYAACACSSG